MFEFKSITLFFNCSHVWNPSLTPWQCPPPTLARLLSHRLSPDDMPGFRFYFNSCFQSNKWSVPVSRVKIHRRNLRVGHVGIVKQVATWTPTHSHSLSSHHIIILPNRIMHCPQEDNHHVHGFRANQERVEQVVVSS